MLGAGEYTRTYGAMAQKLRADFFMDSVKDELASRDAGRDIYRMVERVRIIIPGATATIAVKNVDATIVERYPEEYRAWKAGQEAPVSGTLLEEWPVVNKAQVAELNYRQVRTVEELARLSDIQAQGLGMGGMTLRERARAYLDDALHEQLTTKALAENDLMRSKIAALERQVGELGQQLLVLTQQAAPRPPAFQTFVPGDNDPFQPQARVAFQGAGEQPYPPPQSAIDAFGGEGRPVRPRRGGIDYDDAGADAGADAA